MSLIAHRGTAPPPSLWLPFGDTTKGLSAATDATALATLAGAANRLDLYPLYLGGASVRIKTLGVYVTTGVASALCRVGIYEQHPRQFDRLILRAGTGDLDCGTSSTYRKEAVDFTFQSRKRYFLAVHTSSTATLRGLPLAALWPIASSLTSTAQFTLLRYTAGVPYASGLPPEVTATVAAMTSSIAPAVMMEWY